MTTRLEFGLDSFGDVTKGALGAMLPHAQVIRDVVEEAVLADQLGIDFIGLGERHRADFAISTPEVVVRAAHYDLPIMLAIIGGVLRPTPISTAAPSRNSIEPKPIGVHSPCYVADTDVQAREELWPDYKVMRDRIGEERGWPPMGRDEFVREADHGSLYVGPPETVARKPCDSTFRKFGRETDRRKARSRQGAGTAVTSGLPLP